MQQALHDHDSDARERQETRQEVVYELDVAWPQVLLGWLIGTSALFLLFLSVTGVGTGPAGMSAFRGVAWLWLIAIAIAAAWIIVVKWIPHER